MTTNRDSFTEMTPLDAARPELPPLGELIDRLRSVRLKVGRWLPDADALAAWSVDYAEVYGAATRLERAVQALDAHLAAIAVDDVDASLTDSLSLQMLLCDVEACAEAFEDSVIENLG